MLPAMLDAITSYFAGLSPGWLYLALFLSAYIENIFPPVPGDTVVVFGAYIVGRSQHGFAGVFISTTLGSLAGFMTLYMVGRLVHPEYFIRKNFRLLPAAAFESAGTWFRRWGNWVILMNRFLSGIRSVLSIVCGMYRLPWPRVMLLAFLGCGIWNLALIWAGYELGANWKLIERIMSQYSRVFFTAGALAVGCLLARKKLIRRRERK